MRSESREPEVKVPCGQRGGSGEAKRPKLISFLGHTSAFTVRGEHPATIHTHAMVVRNAGKMATNNVRIGHYVLPDQFQLSPAITHTVERNAGAIDEIIIPKLVPDEQVTVSYLYVPPLQWTQIHAYTKSDEGFAKILNVLPTPQHPKWISRGIWILVFIGIVALIYLVIELIGRLGLIPMIRLYQAQQAKGGRLVL